MVTREPEDAEAIHAVLPFWEHRRSPDGHPHRSCVVCGAVLRRDNSANRCDCHSTRDVRPQHAPDAQGRLLRAFQASAGQVVHPLPEVFYMAAWDTTDRQWVWRQVRYLRRSGHRIVAVAGRSGGYRYLGDVSTHQTASE